MCGKIISHEGPYEKTCSNFKGRRVMDQVFFNETVHRYPSASFSKDSIFFPHTACVFHNLLLTKITSKKLETSQS